eukprot:scaffold1828_cov272-Chaetoceros_neogracile.AAC.3
MKYDKSGHELKKDCLNRDYQTRKTLSSLTHPSSLIPRAHHHLALDTHRTVVSMVHCGCIDPGSIPGLDNDSTIFAFCSGEIVIF